MLQQKLSQNSVYIYCCRQYFHTEYKFLIELLIVGLNLGVLPANERRRYKVTPPLIGWAHT